MSILTWATKKNVLSWHSIWFYYSRIQNAIQLTLPSTHISSLFSSLFFLRSFFFIYIHMNNVSDFHMDACVPNMLDISKWEKKEKKKFVVNMQSQYLQLGAFDNKLCFEANRAKVLTYIQASWWFVNDDDIHCNYLEKNKNEKKKKRNLCEFPIIHVIIELE